MGGNSTGYVFRLHTFGESHGPAIGGIIDGCIPGLNIDVEKVQNQLDRRKPGQSEISTQRKESDVGQFLSGIFEGVTTGTPIGFQLLNEDQRSGDYNNLKDTYRPSHADFTYEAKYGIRDHRGGGRSSARETACRVVAGAVAQQILDLANIKVTAFVSQVGSVRMKNDHPGIDLSGIDANPVRCPESSTAAEMKELIAQLMDEGDTIGGIITCHISGCPAGLGEPVFDKLHAELGKAMLSINAVKGFEVGSGFSSISMKGSEHNDAIYNEDGKIRTRTNFSGGIQGGISNGETIWFKVAFKPVASIRKIQETVNSSGESQELSVKGRHDPCVVPRAVPIVEAMASLVIVDFCLRSQTINFNFKS